MCIVYVTMCMVNKIFFAGENSMKSDITKEMTKEEFIKALIMNCGYSVKNAIRFAEKVYGK